MAKDWLGLTLTRTRKVRRNGKIVVQETDTTDEWAIAYAAKKFDVPEDMIELLRDETIIKVRVKQEGEEDMVEFMSFEQFTYEIYGFPDREDKYYTTYRDFGYSSWLMKAYPEDWGSGEYDQMMFDLRCSYHWYRLEEYLEEELEENATDVLDDFLAGQCIVVQLPSMAQVLPINFPELVCGILIWEEEPETFCLFVDDEGELYPIAVKSDMVEITDEIFEGFDDE